MGTSWATVQTSMHGKAHGYAEAVEVSDPPGPELRYINTPHPRLSLVLCTSFQVLSKDPACHY